MKIEHQLLEYLSDRLDIPVYYEIPSPRPERHVAISKLDGEFNSPYGAATYNIACYGQTMSDAYDIGGLVMYEMPGFCDGYENVYTGEHGGDSFGGITPEKMYVRELVYNLRYLEDENV